MKGLDLPIYTKPFLKKEISYIHECYNNKFSPGQGKIPNKDLTFDFLEDMLFKILQNIACKVFKKPLTKPIIN